jgi:hypothetical protein
LPSITFATSGSRVLQKLGVHKLAAKTKDAGDVE